MLVSEYSFRQVLGTGKEIVSEFPVNLGSGASRPLELVLSSPKMKIRLQALVDCVGDRVRDPCGISRGSNMSSERARGESFGASTFVLPNGAIELEAKVNRALQPVREA